jgi:hypothetical protein
LRNVVTFHQIYPAAIPPMRADKSALGTLSAVSYQYCEAVRTASAFGWYVFPPTEIRLMWDGVDTYYFVDGDWIQLTSVLLGNGFLDYWDLHAPADLKGHAPPYLSQLLVPGVVQIWSGFLVGTTDDWAALVRAPANLPHNRRYACFDGLIETDRYKPCPLFINIQLISTDCEIVIPTTKPLFQLQPVRREAYSDDVLESAQLKGLEAGSDGRKGMADDDWDGFRRTTRSVDPTDARHRSGSYGARVRRRGKSEEKQ